MPFHLVVSEAFLGYRKGQHIEDQPEVERVLASDHEAHVRKIWVAEEPQAAKEAAPADPKRSR